MEILRFEEAATTAPKRNKSSKGFLTLGLVATLFGIGSAFASSTITINATNAVDLGQGVVTVSGCDTNIGFKPVTKLSSTATSFQVTDFIIGYDWSETNDNGLINTSACDLKQMKISLYKDKEGGGVDLVPCWKTYKNSASSADAAAGADLKGTYVGIGRNDTANASFAANVADYKCGTDGSFYFELNSTKALRTGATMRIYWPDQTSFIFNANIFDRVTIESVTNEPGLSGSGA